ncbi:hypothetical protein ACFLX8_04595 [Chloroflexota bacterium]
MGSQDKEKEYERNIWEIYRKEWATANREKQAALNKRMLQWQELMKNGWTASQAYSKVMEEHADTPPSYPFWSRMRKALVIFPILALAAAIVYGVVITGEIDNLKTELESVQGMLTSTQTRLSSTEQALVSTQTELNSTKQTLTSTQSELASTQIELGSTNQKLSYVQQTLTNLEATSSQTQQQLTVAEETLEGLGITLSISKECSDVTLTDNPTATNPTWNQLMVFLSQDQTEKHTYIENVYDCSQFSRDIHDNAETRGIRTALVQVMFMNKPTGHALNAFLTTDYGLVYVDCTEEPDKIARVKAGKEFRSVDLYRITETNVKNDYWWDSLSSYYYIGSSVQNQWVTSSIEIYW